MEFLDQFPYVSTGYVREPWLILAGGYVFIFVV
jgi:hypothetical protein